jgi:predicted MFS family arabinose efflux permease
MPQTGAQPPSTRFLNHVSLIGFASALSTRAVDPIVPPIAQGLAVDPGTVALLTTAFALPFAIVQPILGPIADMIGKVRLMMICLAVITVASLACAFTTSFAMLLAARIICGMAAGGIFPVGLALLGDMFGLEQRQIAIARWLAIVIGGNVLGGALAGVIAGAVLAAFSLGGIFYSLSVRRLTRIWRPWQMMIVGGTLCALALIAISLEMSWPIQFALFLLLGVGFYTLHACIQVEASELSQTSRGAAMSLHSLFFFLGHASGPVLYGLGFAALGAHWSLLVASGLMLFTGLMCSRYLRRP